MSIDAKPRLDRDSRREAILDVAAEVFMECGYAAASMSAIAARVGGSKGTLYNYFKSKEELFAAYVDRQCLWQQTLMDQRMSQATDVRDALTRVGQTLLGIVVSGFGLRNFTIIASEAARVPEIGRAFYEAGPRRGTALVAHCVARASAAGDLRPCDPERAAHHFIGLCQHRLFKARLCNAAPEPSDGEMEAEVAAAVEVFMAAYGPLPD
jgi:AcrR family transcriptional regulator